MDIISLSLSSDNSSLTMISVTVANIGKVFGTQAYNTMSATDSDRNCACRLSDERRLRSNSGVYHAIKTCKPCSVNRSEAHLLHNETHSETLSELFQVSRQFVPREVPIQRENSALQSRGRHNMKQGWRSGEEAHFPPTNIAPV